MATHVYMSVAPCPRAADGSLAPASEAVFNYRGEAGPADDPVGFRRRMAARDHLVVLVGRKLAAGERRGGSKGPPSVLWRELAKASGEG